MSTYFIDSFFERMIENGLADPRKANCHKCQNRGSVPGSAHSSCSLGKVPFVIPNVKLDLGFVELEIPMVAGKEHGIKNGWFIWPVNFDPAWLKYCLLFEQKENDGKSQKE